MMRFLADLESERLVVGYEVLDFEGNSTGGLVMSNFEGEIIKDFPLPYAPYTFEFVD